LDPVCEDACHPAALALAIHHFSDRYLVVGVLEDLPVSLRLYEHLLPLFFDGITTHINRHGIHHNKLNSETVYEPTTTGSRIILEHWLSNDVALYHVIRQRLHTQAICCNIFL
jgi:hypothetical protein